MNACKLGSVDIAGTRTPGWLLDGRVHALRDVLGKNCPSSIFYLLQDWDRWSEVLRKAPAVDGDGLDPEKLVYHSPVDNHARLSVSGSIITTILPR